MRDGQAPLAKLLTERAEREAADLAHVLGELRRSILAEIDTPPPAQFELWPPPEREQLEPNRDDLRRRADAVPAEIERETAAIRARCTDPGENGRLTGAASMRLGLVGRSRRRRGARGRGR